MKREGTVKREATFYPTATSGLLALLVVATACSVGCDGCREPAADPSVLAAETSASQPVVTSWTEIGRVETLTLQAGSVRIHLTGLASRTPVDEAGRAVVGSRSQQLRSRLASPWEVLRSVPRAEVLATAGLEDGSLPRPVDVTIVGDQGTIRFRVGRSERHETKMATWVHVEGQADAHLVEGSLRNLFVLRASAWTESSVVDMPMGGVERVVLHTARGDYALIRRGLNWESEDGRAGEVDPGRVRRILSRLERLEPMAPEPSDPVWVRPEGAVGLSVSDGNRTVRLAVGTQTARRVGQPEPVSPIWIDDANTPVLVRASHAASLQLLPLDLQQIVAWELSACDVQSIRGTVGALSVALDRTSEDCPADGTVIWDAPDLPTRWAQGDRLVRVLLRPRVERRLENDQADGSDTGEGGDTVIDALASRPPTGEWTITLRDGTSRTLQTLERPGDALARYARTNGDTLWLLSEPTARTLTPPRGIGTRSGMRRARQLGVPEGSASPPDSIE